MKQKLIIGTFATMYSYAFYRTYTDLMYNDLSREHKNIVIKYFGR